MALDIAQVPPEKVIYLEDRPLFVQVADTLGIRGILHLDFETTKLELAKVGWEVF